MIEISASPAMTHIIYSSAVNIWLAVLDPTVSINVVGVSMLKLIPNCGMSIANWVLDLTATSESFEGTVGVRYGKTSSTMDFTDENTVLGVGTDLPFWRLPKHINLNPVINLTATSTWYAQPYFRSGTSTTYFGQITFTIDPQASVEETVYGYATANPYHWKCRGIAADWASGTDYDQSMMGGAGLQAFYYFDNPPTLYAPQNAIHVQWDFEYLPSAQTNEICGQVFKNMVLVCEGKIWGPNVAPFFGIDQGALGAVKPKYSIYGGGIYNRAAEGSGTSGWGYITAGNYAVSDLYSDYHNYYTNGTISYATMTGYRAFYKGAIDVIGYMFVTNYQNKINENWYFYNLVHSYDITRKIIGEIGTANATDYSSIRVCSYFWRYFEPVSSGTDVAFCRQAFDYGGILRGDRPEISPSMLQSVAVWSFAYADGLFLWSDSIMGEERQRLIDESLANGLNLLTDPRILTQYCGDTMMIGKGVADWLYVGYWQCVQNKDIIEANTDCLIPDYYKTGAGSYTTGTENYPVSLCANQIPLCRYKLNAAGTEALVIITSPFNNGYTKETHTLRLPAKSNYSFTVDTFGTYTTVLRLTGL